MKRYPDIQFLRDALSYNPETGELVWKEYRNPNARAGQMAGHKNRNGYVAINIGGHLFRAHRIAWAIHYGEHPRIFIDHINGIRSDNSISNLRLATKVNNSANSKRRSDNTSGCKGVHYYKSRGRWVAYIDVNKKRVNIGYFDSYEDAVAARSNAAKRLHGEYFCDDR